MGENVADLAGLTVAHDAYIASLGGAAPPVIDGFDCRPALLLSAGRRCGGAIIARRTFVSGC